MAIAGTSSRFAERRFSTDELCSIPFIEPSDSLVAAYYAQLSTALARVDRADLTTTRDRCRAALETAHKVGAPIVSRGKEEEMGVLTCRFTPPTGTLRCAIPRGTWQFRVRNDSLVGEL